MIKTLVKRLLVIAPLASALSFATTARAAEPLSLAAAPLASDKAPPADDKPSCFSSVANWVLASARDCPLSYGPLTLYGVFDAGGGYQQWGTNMGPYSDSTNFTISRSSGRPIWLMSPNGVSTSNIGLRLNQNIAPGWSLVGLAELGFNPLSFRQINGPQAVANNNWLPADYHRAGGDSSQAGQYVNRQAYAGVSNAALGALTFGRTNTLNNDLVSAYDPVASNAFSQLGYLGRYAGFGFTETTRIMSALTYRGAVQGLRFAAQAQLGGYGMGNASTSAYQVSLGYSWNNFSIDAIGGVAQNAMSLSSFSGAIPVALLSEGYDPNSILRATLGNTGGLGLYAAYDWKPFKFFAGWIWNQTGNPGDKYFPNGMDTIAPGLVVPGGVAGANSPYVKVDQFDVMRIDNTLWVGLRYAATKNLDLSTGFYWQSQSDFQPAWSGSAWQFCTGSGTSTSSSRCAGVRLAASALAVYKLTGRMDLYAGAMYSQVAGGLASEFQHVSSVDPMVGVRFRF